MSGILIAAVTAMVGIGAVSAKERPENDCLIGVQDGDEQTIDAATVTCTDGDACDADGATDGACKFRIRGCVNLPGVPGCEPRPLKTFKFKVKGEKNLIQLTPPDPTQATSVCGAFVDLTVGLKKTGTKPGKRKLLASAKANVKPAGKNKDSDKITFQCNPCPSGSCVPATTTTTAETTSTTSTTDTTTTTEESTTTLETTTTTEESTTTLETTTTTEESSTTLETTTTTEESSTTLETTTTTEESSTTLETTTTTEESSTTLETTTTTEESTTTTTSPSSPSTAFVGDEPWTTSSS